MKSPIQILDYAEFAKTETALNERRKSASEDGEETWERYHQALWAVAEAAGGVGEDPDDLDLDFYHGGDWFHELSDGFAVLTPCGVSDDVFGKFQTVVAAHHPDASLMLGGDSRSPIFGLQILITASEVYVGWIDMTAADCRKQLTELGVVGHDRGIA
jgi:hypothetical protein